MMKNWQYFIVGVLVVLSLESPQCLAQNDEQQADYAYEREFRWRRQSAEHSMKQWESEEKRERLEFYQSLRRREKFRVVVPLGNGMVGVAPDPLPVECFRMNGGCLWADLDAPYIHSSLMALVIGNADYHGAPVQTAVRDAEDIAFALRCLGFQVILRENAGKEAMQAAIRKFQGELRRRRRPVGLLYFAGHGMRFKGSNYLIPVDFPQHLQHLMLQETPTIAEIFTQPLSDDKRALFSNAPANFRKREETGEASHAIGVEWIVTQMQEANPQGENLLILDANGLKSMDPPSGILIAFSSAPGQPAYRLGEGFRLGDKSKMTGLTAADDQDTDDDANSIYTKHLLNALCREPNLSLTQLFDNVRQQVMEETNKQQRPWKSSSLPDTWSLWKLHPVEGVDFTSVNIVLEPATILGEAGTVDTVTGTLTGFPLPDDSIAEESGHKVAVIGIEGVWEDTETGFHYTIRDTGETFTVESVIGKDGKEYEVFDVTWRDGTLTWSYHPSAEELLTLEMIITGETAPIEDTWECSWSGTSDSGKRILKKVRGTGGIEKSPVNRP